MHNIVNYYFMPTYLFKNKETGDVFQKRMKISERETFLKENSNIEPVLTAPAFSYDSDSLSNKQPSDGFKDVLRNIKSKAIGGKNMKSSYI